MPDNPLSKMRLVDPAEVAELLAISVDEVLQLADERRLRGVRVGSPARLRIEEASIADYLDDQAEDERRRALWRQSNEASFPELWGNGIIRRPE